MNSKRQQIRIWELASDYGIEPEEARRALATGGMHRRSTDALVPEAEARRIFSERIRRRRPDRRKRADQDRDQRPSVLSEAAAMFNVNERRLKPRRDAAKPKQRPAGPPNPS